MLEGFTLLHVSLLFHKWCLEKASFAKRSRKQLE